MIDQLVLKLFKAMVVESTGDIDLSNVTNGFVTNFKPTPLQLKLLSEEFKPLDVITLFTVEERETSDLWALLTKQVLHYFEIYGLDSPGLFNLEQKNGKVATLTYVKGISKQELGEFVRALLYANAPIKDAVGLKEVINHFNVEFDLNKVKNNEMRVLLFNLGAHAFNNGDDAVRYMCYVGTESALLIKSKQVIKGIKSHAGSFTSQFFKDHEQVLAEVFHRHKNLILAAKTAENRSAINKISRLAKTEHVTINEPASKRFIAEAYAGKGATVTSLSIRDKFKLLNLLNYKLLGNTADAFVIRNGKVHVEQDRKVLAQNKLIVISKGILKSLAIDLKPLKDAKILLDENVDYGLPISRKQVIGQLPFGTTVTPNGDTISSGVYWENGWGASDLDLSAVDAKGNRTGWGQYSGYTSQDVVFSGDLTSAVNGAMEFMTSKTSRQEPYALFVNVFRGKIGTKFALVVGSKSKDKWIVEPVLREVGELNSRGNIIGFVKNGKFVVYMCRMNGAYWSVGSREAAIVARGMADFWTVRSLFDALDIPYSTKREEGVNYTHNLTYSGFSFDKLETLFK